MKTSKVFANPVPPACIGVTLELNATEYTDLIKLLKWVRKKLDDAAPCATNIHHEIADVNGGYGTTYANRVINGLLDSAVDVRSGQ